MNQRIRYIKSAEGYTSMRMLKARNGTEYRPVLSEDMKTGYIKNVEGGHVAAVVGSSHHKTKIALKKALEKLGVEFMPEGRARKTSDETN